MGMQRIIDSLNILLGIVIIALAAAIAVDTLSARMGKAFLSLPGKPGAQPSTAQPVRTDDLMAYSPILSSGLFGKATQGQLAPIVNIPAALQAVPATAPRELHLLGTASGSFRETFALVRHAVKQEERVFRLGENVFDAGRLAEVTKEKAFILIGGKKVELLTPLAAAAEPAAPLQTVSPQNSNAVASLGSGNYVIDQRALNSALDNLGQVMTDARLLPSNKDGKVEGFRASEVKPKGVFAMLGIKDGDVLQRLNDFPVDSPDKALQSLVALKGQSRLKLDLIRDGAPTTFNYDIR